MKLWTVAHENPKQAALILWGTALLLVILSFMFSCEESKPSNVIVAPVGSWSREIHIPAYQCVIWNPMPTVDGYAIQTYWDNTWTDFRGGNVNASHFRVRSLKRTPVDVTFTFRQIGTC